VKTICGLNGLWGSKVRCRGIIPSAITAHHLDFWVLLYPNLGRFSFAIRQEINHLVTL
jgi:hypothetical protein